MLKGAGYVWTRCRRWRNWLVVEPFQGAHGGLPRVFDRPPNLAESGVQHFYAGHPTNLRYL